MPAPQPDIVVVGRITGAHGVSGQIRVTSATQPPDNLVHYRPWLIADGGSYREVEVMSVRSHGAAFVARLAGVTDRDTAQALAGRDIAVPRSALPALEVGREYYWQDLIGLTVSDQNGTELGRVERLIETGAHDVLVIVDGSRQTLIPFAEPFVVDVDPTARRIRVTWPEPL